MLSLRLDGTALPDSLDRLGWLDVRDMPADQVAYRIEDWVKPDPSLSRPRAIPPLLTGDLAPGTPVNVQLRGQPEIAVELGRWSTAHNVELGGGHLPYGNVLHNAPPYAETDNAVEYTILVKDAGVYMLESTYAAKTSRPVRILLNGSLLRASGMGLETGGWEPRFQVKQAQGAVHLAAGHYVLRIERSSYLPHVAALSFFRQPRSPDAVP